MLLCISRRVATKSLRQPCCQRYVSTQHPKPNTISFFSRSPLYDFHQKSGFDTINLKSLVPAQTEPANIRSYLATASRLTKVYSQLSKSRLTCLIVLSTMAGFALSPLPTTVPMLLSTAIGTALCSASANTFNQIVEVPFDAQMPRTRMRPLVRGAISPANASIFGILTGVAGITTLTCVNPVAGSLGALNIVLYAGVYTSLKRKSIINTWVGSVVGGIPPLIGWVACGGRLLPVANQPTELFLPPFISDVLDPITSASADNPLSALVLFGLLYCWQFPHFNSLAHLLRESYAQGGYKMLAVTKPTLNALVSYRHALFLIGISSVATPLVGLTTWTFSITSVPLNLYLARAAHLFWKSGTEKNAKALFHVSLWYLPVILALMMIHKRGTDWLVFFGFREPPSEYAERGENQNEV